MTFDAAALLEGPRGRRLCFEYLSTALDTISATDSTSAGSAAQGVDVVEKISTTLRWRAFAVDQATGRSVLGTGYQWTSGGHESGPVAGDVSPTGPEPLLTLAEVASSLEHIALPELDPAALYSTLQFTMDVASYWSPPAGADLLASDPDLAPAMRRAAERIAGTASAAWWATGMAENDQWSVDFDDPMFPDDLGEHSVRDDDESSSAVGTALRDWRSSTIADEARARRSRREQPGHQSGGPWWSTPPWGPVRSARSLDGSGPVGLQLVEDSFGPDRAEVRPVDVPRGLRVFEIDGPEAWAALCGRFPIDVTESYRVTLGDATGRVGPWVVPDWSAVAEEWDGVHLSVLGYLRTAGIAVPVATGPAAQIHARNVGDDHPRGARGAGPDRDRGTDRDTHRDTDPGAASVLAGWSPDQTVWFSDRVRVGGPPATWLRDDDDDDEAWARRPDA